LESDAVQQTEDELTMQEIIGIVIWLGVLILVRRWMVSSERRWMDVLIVASGCFAVAEVIRSVLR
jgi:hypothetical protein